MDLTFTVFCFLNNCKIHHALQSHTYIPVCLLPNDMRHLNLSVKAELQILLTCFIKSSNGCSEEVTFLPHQSGEWVANARCMKTL